MEQVSRALGKDEPLMVAWEKYKTTDEYANTLKWAGKSNEGQLWAAFTQGWLAAGGKLDR